jgi:peptide/nickel transport system substrate-binding protein
MRNRLSIAVVCALTAALGLSACTKTGDETGPPDDQKGTQSSGIATDPKESQGPALDIPGAKPGGTLFYLRRSNFSHLDPVRQYSVTAMAVGQMYTRTLTAFKEPGGNRLLLVGDLAETPGTDVKKDCKTWEFKIKKGVKYDDGTEVKAADIAYGISRGFNSKLVGGPTYLQEWLADSPQYTDVWDFDAKGQAEFAPGLTAPDDYTLKFEFKRPHCELPYAVALPFSAPVPKAKDTGVAYDDGPVSSGPYKITKFVKGTELILERNTHWDPKTDPIRHAYPDKIHVKFGIDPSTATNRVIADVGEDKNAALVTVDPALVGTIANNPALQSRILAEQTPFVFYLWINCSRITDVNVRKALNWATDKDAYIKSLGGSKLGEPASTILSPLTVGFEGYNSYATDPTGDPAKAKQLLGNKEVPLVLAHADDPVNQLSAVAIKSGLERAGFKITLVSVPADAFLDKVGEKANPWDIYVSGWAADWSTAATTIPVIFDGRTIKDANNINYPLFNDASVNAEIDRINLIADPAEAAKAWMALDKKIMTDFAPAVPLAYDKDYIVEGSNVGGLYESDSLGTVSFVNAYLISGA